MCYNYTMNFFGKTIRYPRTALCIVFGFGVVLDQYGITSGTMLIFDVFLAVAMYRLITS